ncbi:MAG TPA: radical SAM family heme chaperone HemW, partial [Candidatus Melainabacteria bacterium]|nr:radical SAM family heme chaperone HemW [Candidatus Melainabacteria bacterium]
MIETAYIHIPFCSYKCDFCDFAAFAGLNHREGEYFEALSQEIKARLENTQAPVKLSSIYFGGGTPGMVSPHYIRAILDQIASLVELSPDLEICLEATPHSVSEQKLEQWKALGVSRLSVGIESFHEDELRSIGRDHSREEALRGLELALTSQIPVVSIDFMYGLPTQTLESWQATLDEAIALAERYPALKHISAYGLQLAENSPLYGRFPRDSDSYPDEELFAAMMFLLIDKLRQAGFVHYEVSNFAKEGFQCRHNSTYWRNRPYLAFGVGAHRYVDGVRSANWRSFNRYIRGFMEDEFSEEIDRETEIKEAVMLGLRMRAGIELSDFYSKYGFRLEESRQK